MQLNSWLDKEDALWHQMSSLNQFRDGDRNTSFFHAKTSARHKKNFIEGLLDPNGVGQEDEHKVEEIVVEYYKNLFTSNNPTNFSKLLKAIRLKVSSLMNQSLLKDYTANDVWLVLKQMCHLKATSLNGMPPLFFQHFWSKSGEMETKTILDFLHLGVSPPNFKETHCFNPKNQ